MHIEFNKLLQKLTTLKIGGPVDIFIEVEEEEELSKILYSAYNYGINWLILGEGSKVLVPDEGIRGIIIKLKGGDIKVEKNKIKVKAGISLKLLLKEVIKNNLEGLEFLVGMPGTVGGAIMNNAGFPTISLGDFVNRVKIIDKKGEVTWLSKEKDLKFSYRYSNLPKDSVIVEAELELSSQEDKNNLLKRLREARLKRIKTQPQLQEFPNCGCIFKNPSKDIAAGWLLEKAGCKGVNYGNAGFSQIHANFIVNYGGAKAKDVLSLIEFAKERVFNKFDILLKEEVKILSAK
jgi:UDP-N-acetylmuramate dehydrogenase